MRQIILLLFLSIQIVSYSQITPYDKSSYSTYKPLTPEQIIAPALIMQQKYDRNAAKVDALIQYIFEIKRQTNDKQLLNTMDRYYNTLKKYYDYDLTQMDKQIREMQFAIQEEVDKYNRMLVESQKSSTNTTKGSYKGYQKVYKYSPIYNKPSKTSSTTIATIEEDYIKVIYKESEHFYLVRYRDLEGYLWSGWFKD